MYTMKEGAASDRRLTMDEREASGCVKTTLVEQYIPLSPMNKPRSCLRTETDPVSMLPIGRMITYGFMLLDDSDPED